MFENSSTKIDFFFNIFFSCMQPHKLFMFRDSNRFNSPASQNKNNYMSALILCLHVILKDRVATIAAIYNQFAMTKTAKHLFTYFCVGDPNHVTVNLSL